MSYKNLEIYQLAHSLGVDIHRLSLQFPKFELYETGSQLRRASKSISANIVEGYGRKKYPAEYVRFLIFALASSDETMEWLQYTKDCHT
jgi:four helix bundle protein